MAMVLTVLRGGICANNDYPYERRKQALELTWVVEPFPNVLEALPSPTDSQPFHGRAGMLLGCRLL